MSEKFPAPVRATVRILSCEEQNNALFRPPNQPRLRPREVGEGGHRRREVAGEDPLQPHAGRDVLGSRLLGVTVAGGFGFHFIWLFGVIS